MVIFGPLGDTIKLDYIMIATGAGMILLGMITLTDKKLREAGK
jgi:hypothetical protein